MPRPLTPQSNLAESTARLSQYLAENEISRTEIADALGMSVSGLNSIFHRGVGLSGVQAKAIEQEYGISANWLLRGEEPKMVNLQDKLDLGDRWLLKIYSKDSEPTELKMVTLPKALATEFFQSSAMGWMATLFMRGVSPHEKIFEQLKDWHNDIPKKLSDEWKTLQKELPVEPVQDKISIASAFPTQSPKQLRQWQTMRYFLMDLTTPDEQPLPSSEAQRLGIDIDLSWIRTHREMFLKPWKELLFSAKQKYEEKKEDNSLDEI